MNRSKSGIVYFVAIMILVVLITVASFSDIFGENTFIVVIIAGVAVLAITITWLLLTVAKSKPTAVLTATGVDVKGPMIELSVAFNDVNSIELRDSMKYGIRTFGYATVNIYGGHFRNTEFGAYKMSADNRIKKFIVLHYKDGILVFNFDSPDATQMMYEIIKKRSKKVVDDA